MTSLIQEHANLVNRAEKWLYSIGCKIVIRDSFKSITKEQPDAIGWRNRESILLEVKTSRADFLADRRKSFRTNPELGMGDWRFYLSPKGLIKVEDLPVGWGLLEATAKTIQRTHGYPDFNIWSKSPFIGSKKDESMMMVTALHRMKIKGHFERIYDQQY